MASNEKVVLCGITFDKDANIFQGLCKENKMETSME